MHATRAETWKSLFHFTNLYIHRILCNSYVCIVSEQKESSFFLHAIMQSRLPFSILIGKPVSIWHPAPPNQSCFSAVKDIRCNLCPVLYLVNLFLFGNPPVWLLCWCCWVVKELFSFVLSWSSSIESFFLLSSQTINLLIFGCMFFRFFFFFVYCMLMQNIISFLWFAKLSLFVAYIPKGESLKSSCSFSFGITFWEMLIRSYVLRIFNWTILRNAHQLLLWNMMSHFVRTSWNISYFVFGWFELAHNGQSHFSVSPLLNYALVLL